MEIGRYSNRCIHYYTGEIPEMVESVFKSMPVNNFADLGSGDGAFFIFII